MVGCTHGWCDVTDVRLNFERQSGAAKVRGRAGDEQKDLHGMKMEAAELDGQLSA